MELLTTCKMANLAYKGHNKKINKTNEDELRKQILDFTSPLNYSLLYIHQYRDILYYLLEKDDCKYIVIRGSNQPSSWYRNFNIKKTKQGIHTGFNSMAEYIYENVREYIQPLDNVEIIGHSLGASSSLILGNILYDNGYNIKKIYAFEPANISNKKYINKTKDYNIKRYIIKNNLDIICGLPPKQLAYNNYKTMILYFDRDDNLIINPNKITVALDKMSTMFNIKNWMESVSDHDLSYVMLSIAKNENIINTYIHNGLL